MFLSAFSRCDAVIEGVGAGLAHAVGDRRGIKVEVEVGIDTTTMELEERKRSNKAV